MIIRIAPVWINSCNGNIFGIQAYSSHSNALISFLVPAVYDEELAFKNSKIVWTGGCLGVIDSIQLKNRCTHHIYLIQHSAAAAQGTGVVP